MGSTTLEFQIAENPPARLDKALSRDVPEAASLSRTRIARLLESGEVTINGLVQTNPKAKVAEGDLVSITVPVAEESHIKPEDIPLDVIFEDDDLIVVNKPAGMVVHPAPGSPGDIGECLAASLRRNPVRGRGRKAPGHCAPD